MAETKEFGDFNFDSKNGKEEGQGGRPSKEFLKQKKSIEALQALNEFLPGIAADFLTEFATRSKTRSKSNLQGNIEGIAENPITKLFSPALNTGAGIVAALFAWWEAEEHINNFPPILHLVARLLSSLISFIEGFEEFSIGDGNVPQTIKDVEKFLASEEVQASEDPETRVAAGAFVKLEKFRQSFSGANPFK